MIMRNEFKGVTLRRAPLFCRGADIRRGGEGAEGKKTVSLQ